MTVTMTKIRVAVDFETEAIVGNPIVDPPRPIGVAIKGVKDAEYHTGTPAELGALLSELWNNPLVELVFHNAPFDLRVAEEWCSLDYPAWNKVHDTQFLLFLADPLAPSLGLKQGAEAVLDIKPEERDELKEWIIGNIRLATSRTWGAYISEAPRELVEKYAKMDAEMTLGLFEKLHPTHGGAAYDVERELQRHLTRATQRGVRADVSGLREAEKSAESGLQEAQERIFGILDRRFDLHNGRKLAEALYEADVMNMHRWKRTPTGKRSTKRDVLMDAIKPEHHDLMTLLAYAGAMRTCLNTFIGPWLKQASEYGRLHPAWNQVRGEAHGTRTGRMSSSEPNFQNIPKAFELELPEGLPPIPNMRDYILPERGRQWVSRDYSAQEVRLLAEFLDERGGSLLQEFEADPTMDPHARVAEMMGVSRKQAKTIAFGIIYGMGNGSLGHQLGVNPNKARGLRDKYLRTVSGLGALQGQLEIYDLDRAGKEYERKNNFIVENEAWEDDEVLAEALARRKKEKRILKRKMEDEERMPVKTIGGRSVAYEPNKEYKRLNYLIQGSAADQTKCALLRWFRNPGRGEVFMAVVHDEINISAPIGTEGESLRSAMENDELVKVPMRTTLTVGSTWGNIK